VLVGTPKDDGAPWRGASSAELSSNGVTSIPASIGYACSAGTTAAANAGAASAAGGITAGGAGGVGGTCAGGAGAATGGAACSAVWIVCAIPVAVAAVWAAIVCARSPVFPGLPTRTEMAMLHDTQMVTPATSSVGGGSAQAQCQLSTIVVAPAGGAGTAGVASSFAQFQYQFQMKV